MKIIKLKIFIKKKKSGFALLETMLAVTFIAYALVNIFLLLNNFLNITNKYIKISNQINEIKIIYSDSDPSRDGIKVINIKEKDEFLENKLIKDELYGKNDDKKNRSLQSLKMKTQNEYGMQISKSMKIEKNKNEKK